MWWNTLDIRAFQACRKSNACYIYCSCGLSSLLCVAANVSFNLLFAALLDLQLDGRINSSQFFKSRIEVYKAKSSYLPLWHDLQVLCFSCIYLRVLDDKSISGRYMFLKIRIICTSFRYSCWALRSPFVVYSSSTRDESCRVFMLIALWGRAFHRYCTHMIVESSLDSVPLLCWAFHKCCSLLVVEPYIEIIFLLLWSFV